MLNIFDHKENANRNDIEIPPHPSQNYLSSIIQTTTNAGEDVGTKGTLLFWQ
jgi:hypothetical protein